MKYSYIWLKEITKTKKNPEELAEMIMLKGFELEGIENLADRYRDFVVGKILEIKKHPNADKLQLVKVDIGKKKLEVVCGAWNIKVGDNVPVALVGAIVPLNKMKVEKREVRGAISNGMLCAEDELELGKDHSGIMILDKSLKPGTSLAKALDLEDEILEFDVLPNRAHDCLSYEGMGREISSMEGRNLKFSIFNFQFSKKTQSKKSKLLKIEIKDKKLCPRYIGAVLTGVKIGPSPKWMQARLAASGMEPINNVVDITNYVMLETGNPLHAFDLNKILNSKSEILNKSKIKNSNTKKATIIVRKARKDEKLELLDGSVLKLDENDLVIANEEKALALAGIKGGKDSGISNETTDIVLEAANFQALNIRKSRQRHSLLTESQQRFEKAISPVLAKRSVSRAIEFLQKHADAKLVEINDADFSKQKPQLVKLETQYASKLLGYEVAQKQVINILESLGFVLKNKSAKTLVFEVPYWRLDIEGQEDLVEEVGRIVGYEKIAESPIDNIVEMPMENKERDFEWRIKDVFVGLGFDEAVNYSFVSNKDREMLPDGKYFELENPLSEDQALLRRSLLPNLLKNAALNAKNYGKFSIFEVGRAYAPEKYDGNPEQMKIAGIVLDENLDAEQIFYLAKSKLDGFFEVLKIRSKLEFKPLAENHNKFFHGTRTAEILLSGENVGFLGQANPLVARQYHLKKEVVVFEMDFGKVMHVSRAVQVQYEPARKFPVVQRDISMFVDHKVLAGDVRKTIKKIAGNDLSSVDLFDVFVDKEKGRKSLAFHMSFGNNNKTLSGDEAEEIFNKIASGLQKQIGAEIRSK